MGAIATEDYEKGLTENLTRYYSCLGLSDITSRIADRRSRRRGKQVVAQLDGRVGPGKYRILDVGCGWGEMILELKEWDKAGEIWGIEPDPELHELSSRIHGNVKRAGAEALPFEDGEFDIVVLNDVIEHVRDQRRSLGEIVRVLKPGGILYYSFPNYRYPYEGHYKIPFLPFSNRLPRIIGEWYLRAIGRNPWFLRECLNPLSKGQFLAWLGAASARTGRSLKVEDFSMYIGGKIRRGIFGPQSVRGVATLG